MSESPRQLKRPTAREGELLANAHDNGHLINQYIVQLLVEKDSPEEIKELMRAELDYNKERLGIIREHAEKHPDAIEERKKHRFRRLQYGYLMLALPMLVYASHHAPVLTGAMLTSAMIFVIVSIALNGRDRDNDSELLAKILEKLPGFKE